MLKSNIDYHSQWHAEHEMVSISNNRTMDAEVEAQKELIAIDDGRIKSLEAEIANIKQRLSVIEFHVRRENFGTIQLEEPTEE